MKAFVALFVILAGFLAPLFAGSFETNVTGHIRANRTSGLKMAIASVSVDPLWGHPDQASFEKYEKEVGPLPNVTIKGSGYTNSKGRFLFPAKVSWDDAGTMPTKTYRSKEGVDVEYVCIYVIFKATAEGYATSTQAGRINEGFEATVDFSMTQASILKGGVVLAEGRKSVPNLKLMLFRRMYSGGTNKVVEDIRYEFTTDQNGFFEVSGDDVPTGMLSLRVVGNKYAFETGSAGWRSVSMRAGTNDLGILTVVPGGSVKFKGADADTNKSIPPFYGTLVSTDQNNRSQFHIGSDADGVVAEDGIPVGTYRLVLRMNEHYAPEVTPIEIKTGQTIDLGTIKCEPMRTLDILVFGPDGGLARYKAAMVYLGDNPPPARRSFREGEPIRAGGQLTAENTGIKGLFSGDWLLTVSAEAHADYVATVTLPHSGPLRVTLDKAGTIEYRLEDGSGREVSGYWAFALRHDSPAHEQMAGLDFEGLKKYTHRDSVLPEGAYRKAYRGNRFENLIAGTYLLLADGRGNIVLTADDVLLKTGGTVSATLLPKPGKLTIKVTDNGKPKRNYSFYLRFEGDRQPQVKLTTDKTGVVVHESTLSAWPWVLTEAENDWVTGSAGRDSWSVLSDSIFPGRRAQMGAAQENEFTLEVSSPDEVFVRVSLDMQDGQSVTELALNRTDADRSIRRTSFRSARLGDEFCFVCVPQGTYTVRGRVDSGGTASYFNSEIVVNKTGEQSFDVTVDLYRLDIKLKIGEETSMDDVRVYLARTAAENYWPRREPTLLTPDSDGSITFDCLSPADYQLFVRVYDDGGVLVNALRTDINLKGNKSVTVPISDKVGTVSVLIEGEPLRSRHGVRGRPTVYFVNSKGNVVQPGDPSLLDEVYSYNFSLPGVPVGSYTVIVAAPGFQPFEIEDVKIEKGKTISLKATPEKAGSLVINLSNLYFDMATEIHWFYEDAKGNPLEIWLPSGSVTTATMGDHKGNGGIMEFTNLTPDVKQVRVRVEGYKDIVVKLDVKAGEVITKDVRGQAK